MDFQINLPGVLNSCFKGDFLVDDVVATFFFSWRSLGPVNFLGYCKIGGGAFLDLSKLFLKEMSQTKNF